MGIGAKICGILLVVMLVCRDVVAPGDLEVEFGVWMEVSSLVLLDALEPVESRGWGTGSLGFSCLIEEPDSPACCC